ncbi:MAG TPA: nitroreductase family protein [Acidimicrobiales bacterium]|jgi:nitroreductase|nr:nitroreductase family protein [Acidimicrobiales bacterium]
MDILEALYTTRAMRRVERTPIPTDVQALILDAAVRAPSGGNTQNWRFLLVDDPALIAQLAPLYREAVDLLWEHVYKDRLDAARANPEDPESKQFQRIVSSVEHAAEEFARYPLLLFGFVQHDPTGGSIFPAIWSAMLAARSRGVGSTLTSVLLFKSAEVLDLLGVPADEGWIMAGCVTFGYPTGRWGVAPRRPVEEVAHRNQWGAPLGFAVDGPLWPEP